MLLTKLHASLLSQAFERVLGAAEHGAMAYVRCLTSDILEALARTPEFAPKGWQVWRVADSDHSDSRTLTADRAVEMREAKADPALLLVDTSLAGAGMDGIYSAAREVQETEVFMEAIRLAAHEVTRSLSRKQRQFAERAVKKARSRGRSAIVSPWAEFDFYARCASEQRHPGQLLYLLGLWPVKDDDQVDDESSLGNSLRFVHRLLGTASAASTPASRIEAIKLLDPTDEQRDALQGFLRLAATKPLLGALEDLATQPELWVNGLVVEGPSAQIHGVDLVSWRNRNGKIATWSGLEDRSESPPELILDPDAANTGRHAKFEIRWRAQPANLDKGAAEYRISIMSDMNEELAVREVPHTARRGEERLQFSNDDFPTLSEDALISAKAVVAVVNAPAIEPQDSEEFRIRFGTPPEQEKGGVGRKVRTFGEGLIELDDRDQARSAASGSAERSEDGKGFVVLRTHQRGKSYRVFRPPLMKEVERDWSERDGAMGRWRVRVRASGDQAGAVEFVPFPKPNVSEQTPLGKLWDRTQNAARRMAERFSDSAGGVGQVYDEKADGFDTVTEYLLAWAALLESSDLDTSIALVHTVEVQSLSGKTIGLIVLPAHPLRVAWHVAHDNLALHARFEENLAFKDVRSELAALDGAMFPAFLPGLDGKSAFVFADTLGFHAVGMVLDVDKEPKAAVALLARALGEAETAEAAPTVGSRSAEVLGKEIIKYVECHGAARLLHVHALRPGDGLTVARSLGKVCQHLRGAADDEADEGEDAAPAFVLELYPSEAQRGVSGRFLAEVCAKRRSGAGSLSSEDAWMSESLALGGGFSLPRLRWARRDEQTPSRAAHLAAAFDTFESRVIPVDGSQPQPGRPLFAFGLLSFFERRYTGQPAPLWESFIPSSSEGEKHPSDRTHTERLLRIQQVLQRAVSRSIGGALSDIPFLRTAIPPEKADDLREIHRLCDWVITLDRNAGIEYFDSPRDNQAVYDAYVIDCVPEREDLGCLQLITSTSNLEEVRGLLDRALDQMGLSHSLRNAQFLLSRLKALSGRLAIRLTGRQAVTGELIALALVWDNCREAQTGHESWTALSNGFFVPVDDVQDLLPPLIWAKCVLALTSGIV